MVLAGCGGSDGDPDAGSPGDPAGAGTGGPDGVEELTVGYFPLVHTVTAVHAEEAGIFADEGLDITLEQTAGGAQAIPSLVAGEYDITYGNFASIILAVEQGLPLRIIAGNDVGAADHAIMVREDSTFQSAADLEGGRVAVNNLENIGTVAVNALVTDAGGDPDAVEFVELAYPDMQAALDRGDVDAIWQVEPFQAGALEAGHRVLVELFSGPVADMPVAGWVTTEQFADENPEVIQAFRRALAAAVDEVQDNRELLVEKVPTYTEVPVEVVEAVAMPVWDAEPNVEQLQKLADLMESDGITSGPTDVAQIIISD
ncbi:ABC transporter substrate-binding protein [Phytoactinopolyspora halotolerans]|uniref:ABC transporter substrate-binding protein n=2 Tax=Phytoactinopolyspora halotolerans TaxID=1981512 RepID=A0A6L9S9M4_9ACTN|nr:ABC transporter substrate-binding protein [Phytoactinopolyspora halotolerans]